VLAASACCTQVETDSSTFFIYGSWDSMQSYVDHFHADYTKTLLDFAQVRPLYRICTQFVARWLPGWRHLAHAPSERALLAA
jgi:hypothetical protein